MYKLLINSPTGEQKLEYVKQSGSYFDQSRVLWDERADGLMPAVVLGKMQRVGEALQELPDFLPQHQAWIDAQQAVIDELARIDVLEAEAKADAMLAQLASKTPAQIDTWYDSNITTLQAVMTVQKKLIRVVSIMINKGM